MDIVNNRICFTVECKPQKLVKLKSVLSEELAWRARSVRGSNPSHDITETTMRSHKHSDDDWCKRRFEMQQKNVVVTFLVQALKFVRPWAPPTFRFLKHLKGPVSFWPTLRQKLKYCILLHHTVGMKNINRRLFNLYHLSLQRLFLFFRIRRLTQVWLEVVFFSRHLRSLQNLRWPW